MEKSIRENIETHIRKSIQTKQEIIVRLIDGIYECGKILAKQLQSGKKVLFCGNGGSAADSQHLAAELVIRYRSSVPRRALPGIALTVDPSIMTAGSNDIGFENVFARQVEALGNEGDVLVGISTSGKSPNVVKAIEQAKQQKMITIGLVGGNGGQIAQIADKCIIVPSNETAIIQESHIMIGHIWCEIIEQILFPDLLNDKS